MIILGFRLCSLLFLSQIKKNLYFGLPLDFGSWQNMNHLLVAIVRHLESSSDTVFKLKPPKGV